MRLINTYKAYLLISLVFLFQCTSKEAKQDDNPFSSLRGNYMEKLSGIEKCMDELIEGNAYRKNLSTARRLFKEVEVVMAFTEASDYKSLNKPNILIVKEEDQTDIKIADPLSFQVLEEEIYAENPDSSVVRNSAEFIKGRMQFLMRNTSFSHYKKYHFLWMIRKGIIRVATTGITGFDSPVLANSVNETKLVYNSIDEMMSLFSMHFKNEELLQEWQAEIQATIKDLDGDFGTFDRYAFIKNHTNKQIDLWNLTVDDWQVEFPLTLSLNNHFISLFSAEAFNPVHFSDRRADVGNQSKIVLGRKLFNDQSLSKDGEMSCATCHDKAKAFTDGLKLSKGQLRNSPTLTYAGLQKAFFYDNRAGSLEGQIVSVINSETEFHTSVEEITKKVGGNGEYSSAFDSLYKDGVTDHNTRNAIANYIRSLAPFNSKFDRNIRGEEETLTSLEVQGFNIFMGKGSCATCHFPPVFNGTVPPEFADTEMELIGTPETSDNQKVDDDPGRFNIFKTEERKFFFKTPTVRNVSLTAPYMHNGVYESLDQVMDFYNNGGGAGMGFDLPLQTLPFDSLGLTSDEQKAVIAFMETLTDQSE